MSLVKRTRARLDVQMSVENWLPEVMVVAPAGLSESNHAALHVESGKLYLYDRGFSGFALLDAHYREDGERFVPLEQVIAAHLAQLFPGMEIAAHHSFRVARNADLTLEE